MGPALDLTEETALLELTLQDFECLLDVIAKDFYFHSYLAPLPARERRDLE